MNANESQQNNQNRPRKRSRDNARGSKELEEKVVQIRRVSKTGKGGRTMSFTALVVVGNKQGSVGIGLGKANEVKEAVRKGVDQAKKHMTKIQLEKDTIMHEVTSKFKAAKVLLKPASKGTGVIAGSSIRVVLELVGVKDILTKQLGSSNPINNAYATLEALTTVRDQVKISQLRAESVQNNS